jgi:hypothetical protein
MCPQGGRTLVPTAGAAGAGVAEGENSIQLASENPGIGQSRRCARSAGLRPSRGFSGIGREGGALARVGFGCCPTSFLFVGTYLRCVSQFRN